MSRSSTSSSDAKVPDGIISKDELKTDYLPILIFIAQALANVKVNMRKKPSFNKNEIAKKIGNETVLFTDNTNTLRVVLDERLEGLTTLPETETNNSKVNEKLDKFLKNVQNAASDILKQDGGSFTLIKKEINEVKNENELLKKELTETNKKLASSETMLKNETSKMNTLETKLKSANDALDKISKNKDESTTRLLKNCQQKETALERQIQELEDRLRQVEPELNQLETKNNTLKRELDSTKGLLKSKQDRSTQLFQDLNQEKNVSQTRKSEIDSLKAKIRELEDTKSDIETEKEELQREIKLKNAEIEELGKEKPQKITNKNNKFRQELESQIEQLETQLAELRDSCEEKDEVLQDLEEDNKEKEEELKKKEEQIDEIKEDNQNLEENLEQKKKELEEKTDKVENLEKETKKLKKAPPRPSNPEEQWNFTKTSDEACDKIQFCNENIVESFTYNNDALPSVLNMKIRNSTRDLTKFIIKLDDGDDKTSPDENKSGVLYEFTPSDAKALLKKSFAVKIIPSKDKTTVSFPGFDISMKVDKDEFDPVEANKINRAAVITVRTVHKNGKGKEQILGVNIDKWQASLFEDTTPFETTKTTPKKETPLTKETPTTKETSPKKRTTPKTSESSEKAFVSIRGPNINEKQNIMATKFQIPKIGKENLADISFELTEQGRVTKICTDNNTKNLLTALFLDNGLAASVEVVITILSYDSNNRKFSRSNTNIEYSPKTSDSITNKLNIFVYLCGDSGITKFDKSYILTLKGIGTEGTSFTSVISSSKPELGKSSPLRRSPTQKKSGTINTTGSGTSTNPTRLRPVFDPQIKRVNSQYNENNGI